MDKERQGTAPGRLELEETKMKVLLGEVAQRILDSKDYEVFSARITDEFYKTALEIAASANERDDEKTLKLSARLGQLIFFDLMLNDAMQEGRSFNERAEAMAAAVVRDSELKRKRR